MQSKMRGLGKCQEYLFNSERLDFGKRHFGYLLGRTHMHEKDSKIARKNSPRVAVNLVQVPHVSWPSGFRSAF